MPVASLCFLTPAPFKMELWEGCNFRSFIELVPIYKATLSARGPLTFSTVSRCHVSSSVTFRGWGRLSDYISIALLRKGGGLSASAREFLGSH